jgi:hypothetical protein
MAIRRGRFEEIYRRQTAQGAGTISAIGSASLSLARERADLRRLFPKTGILGAMLESTFGKAYKYSDKGGKGGKGAGVSANTSSLDDKSLSVIRINTSIMAKNSMVLPGMARDMNVMRQNIVKMTRKTVGSAVTKADAHFLKSKERESSYEATLEREEKARGTTPSATANNRSQGLLSSIVGGLSANFGTTGAIIGSIFSGLGTVVGGAFSIFKGIASSLGVLGMGGIVLSIIAGSLVSAMFNNLDFNKFGAQFADVGNSIAKSISSFFGIKETDNKKGPSIFKQVADYLDNTFKTTGFNDGLAFIIKQWKNLADEISYQIAKLYNNIMINVTASFMAVGDIFVGIGKDIKAIFYKWLDDNTVGLYTVFGAATGRLAGPGGAVAGAVAGASYGLIEKNKNESRESNLIKWQNKINKIEPILAEMKAKNLNVQPGFGTRTKESLEKELNLAKQHVTETQQEIENRKGASFEVPYKSGMKPYDERFRMYKEQAQTLFPEPTRQNGSAEKASTSPTRLNNNVTFRDLTKEQQDALLIAQRGEEGFKPGTASYDLNNPGNLYYSEQTARFGANRDLSGRGVGDAKGKFASFPTLEAGTAAQRDLWMSSGYADKPLDEALKKWTGSMSNPEKTENYRKNIFAKISIESNEAVNKNTEELNKLNKQMEDKKEENFTEILATLLQGMASATTGTNVTNVNNTSVSSGNIASPYNDDLLTLFKSRAAQGF